MGTNFYRIPTHEEMLTKKVILEERIKDLNLSPYNIENFFSIIQVGENTWDTINPWDEFTKDMRVHLGKRSGGWQFCWNFNRNKYYHNKESLLQFIRSGRVVDEYGTEWDVEEFIEMALNWCLDGWAYTYEYYKKEDSQKVMGSFYPAHSDTFIDGLRVSSTDEFS